MSNSILETNRLPLKPIQMFSSSLAQRVLSVGLVGCGHPSGSNNDGLIELVRNKMESDFRESLYGFVKKASKLDNFHSDLMIGRNDSFEPFVIQYFQNEYAVSNQKLFRGSEGLGLLNGMYSEALAYLQKNPWTLPVGRAYGETSSIEGMRNRIIITGILKPQHIIPVNKF